MIFQVMECGNAEMTLTILNSPVLSKRINPTVKNAKGDNLIHLCVNGSLDAGVMDKLLNSSNGSFVHCVNETNKEGLTPFLLASSLGKWEALKMLLTHDKLRSDKGEGVADVCKAAGDGCTCLVHVLTAR